MAPFYGYEDWGLEHLNDFLKVTQPQNEKSEFNHFSVDVFKYYTIYGILKVLFYEERLYLQIPDLFPMQYNSTLNVYSIFPHMKTNTGYMCSGSMMSLYIISFRQQFKIK